MGAIVDQAGVLIALGLSFALNIGLVVALVLVVRQNRLIASEAMDAILAATNLPAAGFQQNIRERAMAKVKREPVERERRVLH